MSQKRDLKKLSRVCTEIQGVGAEGRTRGGPRLALMEFPEGSDTS